MRLFFSTRMPCFRRTDYFSTDAFSTDAFQRMPFNGSSAGILDEQIRRSRDMKDGFFWTDLPAGERSGFLKTRKPWRIVHFYSGLGAAQNLALSHSGDIKEAKPLISVTLCADDMTSTKSNRSGANSKPRLARVCLRQLVTNILNSRPLILSHVALD